MRIEESGALILEGQTEAHVLGHYCVTELGGRFLDWFEPPLPAEKMGWLAFVGSRVEDFLGTSEKVEHRVEDPRLAERALLVVALETMPNSLFFGSPRLGRRRFVQKMFEPFRQTEPSIAD